MLGVCVCVLVESQTPPPLIRVDSGVGIPEHSSLMRRASPSSLMSMSRREERSESREDSGTVTVNTGRVLLTRLSGQSGGGGRRNATA